VSAAAVGPSQVALAVSSCGRPDLLGRTLASLKTFTDVNFAEVILVDDANSADCRTIALSHFPDATVILNAVQAGQIASLDRAYGRIASPYVFHCEDDWEFFRSGFIGESLQVLEVLPTATMVSGIAKGVLPDMDVVLQQCELVQVGSISFRQIPADAHPLWFGYSFNPGLRRRDDYLSLPSFGSVGHEADVSLHFKKRGMSMAVLEEPFYTHIGDGRHVEDPVFPITRSDSFLQFWHAEQQKKGA
jgi:hypothetical protein